MMSVNKKNLALRILIMVVAVLISVYFGFPLWAQIIWYGFISVGMQYVFPTNNLPSGNS